MDERDDLTQVDQVSIFMPSSPIHGASFRSTVIHHRAGGSPGEAIPNRHRCARGFIPWLRNAAGFIRLARFTPDEATPQTDKLDERENLTQID